MSAALLVVEASPSDHPGGGTVVDLRVDCGEDPLGDAHLCLDGARLGDVLHDPFGRATGVGDLSAFTVDSHDESFAWDDAAFAVPEIDELIVYETNVREFNKDFDGLRGQLDYIAALGVNALELMPVSNVKERMRHR